VNGMGRSVEGSYRPRMTRRAIPIGALAASLIGLATLVPPALAAAPQSPDGPVSVALSGALNTRGLDSSPSVSELKVSNVGTTPLTWSLRATDNGAPSRDLRIRSWDPQDEGCATGRTARPASTVLAAGASSRVCVELSYVASGAVGPVTPVVTVVAHPA